MGQLTGLREQQKAYISEIGRYQDRRSALTGQLALIKKTTEQVKEEVIENTTDPKTTSAWAQLASRKADLEAQMQRMLTELKPKHPDVLAKQAEIDSVKQSMDEMVSEWKQKIKEKQEKLRDRPDLHVANLEAELRLMDSEIKRGQRTLADIEKQIGELMNRINTVPGVEVALGSSIATTKRRRLPTIRFCATQQSVALGADAASQQQGESIQVIDSAYLPSQPVAPKRFLLFAMGLGLGLGLGLLLAAVFEVPKLLTIQNREDAAHYTGLPVLVTVPELLTPQEARAIPAAQVAAGGRHRSDDRQYSLACARPQGHACFRIIFVRTRLIDTSGMLVIRDMEVQRVYAEFYGLKELPFALTPDPRFIYFTPSHTEVMANLHYGIESGKGSGGSHRRSGNRQDDDLALDDAAIGSHGSRRLHLQSATFGH